MPLRTRRTVSHGSFGRGRPDRARTKFATTSTTASVERVLLSGEGSGGMAVIVVEQHAKLALSLTRKALVLERGRIVHRAASEALSRDRETLHRLVAVA